MDSGSIAPDFDAKSVFRIQAFTLSGLALLFYAFYGQLEAQGAFYGGAIVLFNTWVTHRRLKSAQELAKIAPGREVAALYLAAMQRFVFTLVFFAVGMGVLELAPVPMLVGFAVVQFSYHISSFLSTKQSK
jgi:ATP synthase protein I